MEPFGEIQETSFTDLNDKSDTSNMKSECDLDQLLGEEEIDLLDLETSDMDVDPGSISPLSLSSMSAENIFHDVCSN